MTIQDRIDALRYTMEAVKKAAGISSASSKEEEEEAEKKQKLLDVMKDSVKEAIRLRKINQEEEKRKLEELRETFKGNLTEINKFTPETRNTPAMTEMKKHLRMTGNRGGIRRLTSGGLPVSFPPITYGATEFKKLRDTINEDTETKTKTPSKDFDPVKWIEGE